MATTTTNFGWTIPSDTDLVKDGAAAMRTLGNNIDTSMVDLKGGTSGQVLSKASNADMDFTWVAQDDSNAIQNAIIDAKGDLIVGTAADTPARLAVGTNGYVLTADSTAAAGIKWAAAAGGGKILQVVQGTTNTLTSIISTTFTDSGLSATITPSSSSSRILVMVSQAATVSRSDSSNWHTWRLMRDSTPIWNNDTTNRRNLAGFGIYNISNQSIKQLYTGTYVDSPATTSATTYKTQWANHTTANSASVECQSESGESSIILMEIGA